MSCQQLLINIWVKDTKVTKHNNNFQNYLFVMFIGRNTQLARICQLLINTGGSFGKVAMAMKEFYFVDTWWVASTKKNMGTIDSAIKQFYSSY